MADVPVAQIPGVYRRRIGDIVVTAISDGYLDAIYEFMRDIEPAEAERILKEAYRPAPPRVSINCFVIHSSGRVALVETGSGDKMGPTLGKMPVNLAKAGIDTKSIDTIILTHMHPDHSNGLTDDSGAAIFPDVELVVSERDVAHWHDDAAMARATERQKLRFFQWAREQVKPYMNRRRDAQGEVFPGVTAVPLYGHTPGHTGYMVSSNGEQLLIWGDIVHQPHIQLARPEAGALWDVDYATAAATRRKVLDLAARERLAVAGCHLDFPAVGHIARAADGYAFVPRVWSPTV
jgi:glyoxylase-like metal-dependent hydrolase (beta-lactamase superfamily II)